MGCPKLTYYQDETPLKVVYRADEQGQNPVQWFISVDPLAEKMKSFSPYAYTYNNPVKFYDPDGKQGKAFFLRPISVSIQASGLNNSKRNVKNGMDPASAYFYGQTVAAAVHLSPLVVAGVGGLAVEAFVPIASTVIIEQMMAYGITKEAATLYVLRNPKTVAYLMATVTSLEGASTPGTYEGKESLIIKFILNVLSMEGDTDPNLNKEPEPTPEPQPEQEQEQEPEPTPTLESDPEENK